MFDSKWIGGEHLIIDSKKVATADLGRSLWGKWTAETRNGVISAWRLALSATLRFDHSDGNKLDQTLEARSSSEKNKTKDIKILFYYKKFYFTKNKNLEFYDKKSP